MGFSCGGRGYALQTGQSIFSLDRGQLFTLYAVWPILIGLAVGTAVRYELVKRGLTALGVQFPPPPEPIRTPWPVVIPTLAVGDYLTVRLRTGAGL